MNRSTILTAVAVVGVLGWAGAAYADLEVEKEVTAIDADANPDFEITGSAAILSFLSDVPNTREITFEVTVTVESVGETLSSVVVRDRFGAELDVECVSATTAGDCTDVQIMSKSGTSAKEYFEWTVGNLTPGEVQTLVLTATTKLDPGGFQLYTQCGPHELNSGPVVKGLEVRGNRRKLKQQSDVGALIDLIVSGLVDTALPQCSNCIDDDFDTKVDFPDDLDCADALDDNETS